ncbi:hypothetical protein SFRURICE_005759 [Spodoptera frugiperda]|nr:hypothetical protein SFRURICE_005759 [Spodoptera frugiperda]
MDVDQTPVTGDNNSAHSNYLVKKYGDITPEAHNNLLETGTKVTNGDTKGKLEDYISVIKVIERGTNYRCNFILYRLPVESHFRSSKFIKNVGHVSDIPTSSLGLSYFCI